MHVFVDGEEKQERGEVTIGSYARATPIHKTAREGINDILDDGHEVDDDGFTDPENKSIPTGDNDRKVYREVWKWSGIYHIR